MKSNNNNHLNNKNMKDLYMPIGWPEIQEFMEYEGFRENAHLINDDYGYEKFGDSAYFVNVEWMNRIHDKK